MKKQANKDQLIKEPSKELVKQAEDKINPET